MAVGCILLLSPSGEILSRKPCWPWPKPGEYPKETPNGCYFQFLPINYHRFRIGDKLSSFPPLPYTPKGVTMKTIARNVVLSLFGDDYTCDVLLSLYANSQRPAIILNTARPLDFPEKSLWEGEPIAVASVNLEALEDIPDLPTSAFGTKNWGENAGLWEQLSQLKDENSHPLFLPLSTHVRTGFVQSQLYTLGTEPAKAFKEIVEQYHKNNTQEGDF